MLQAAKQKSPAPKSNAGHHCGSALNDGHDVALDAARDMTLVSSQDVSTLKGSNKSGGGSLGVSIGDRGITVDVAANVGRGKEW